MSPIGLSEQLPRRTSILIEQREQYMRRVDLRMVPTDRQRLRIGQCLLELCGQFVGSHWACLVDIDGLRTAAGADPRKPCAVSLS